MVYILKVIYCILECNYTREKGGGRKGEEKWYVKGGGDEIEERRKCSIAFCYLLLFESVDSRSEL